MRVLIIVLCLLSSSLFAQFRCIKVLDGDTFIIEDDSTETQYVVTLKDVQTPELGQGHYQESKFFLVDKILGKIVYLEDVEGLFHGRFIAKVLCEDEVINQEVVRTGNGYVFRKHCKDAILYLAEAYARHYLLGVWNQCDEMFPWDFTRLKPKKL